MGTGYSVKIAGAARRTEGLGREIEALLDRIDGRMSTYDERSELSAFNHSASTDWIRISAETRTVIDEALRISELTDGAFDMTVGPVVNLWGFGPDGRPRTVPSRTLIAAALERVDYRQVRTRASPPAVRKERPGVYIDLSGIAKGYAVDEIARHLERSGITDYLVDVGGELRARGRNAQGLRWRVAVETPDPDERSVYRILALDGTGVATSGDYRNYFERQGRRYSHTIDPRTGAPIEHALASVTVVHASAMRADGMATALMVLGPEAGYRLAEREKLAALFIVREKGAFVEKHTRELERHIVDG
ncbi:MAG: FAD:protein FMN transferase [Gammaproteobacteria bacterium]|nr:FAD:protein FMN transferase [Gammaproteobacteria bacterium]NIR83347.1 FAD:protein FMN transferase [Gammaproteobacteria bacterium]NIR91147.1 FAD:protein FMN transferase [Gammaproteobacteria bacterium]NIU04514.1 FAD:protein FMN transferase [Gammaproteobacteria bacterium]NIW87150.1 FAD:protein FMN transferase ApbE [Gammaproteobacteria bacterium]